MRMLTMMIRVDVFFVAAIWLSALRRTTGMTLPAPLSLKGEMTEWTLKEKKAISPDTWLLRCAMEAPEYECGIPAGKHCLMHFPNPMGKVAGQWNGKPDATADKETLMKPYTPISDEHQKGIVDLVIKSYRPSEPEYPDGGKASHYVDRLTVGDKIKVSGPVGRKTYLGKGSFKIDGEEEARPQCTQLGLIAGGSGITPLYAIARKILKSQSPDEKKINVHFIFANNSEEDILCRDELEKLEQEHPKRFKLWFTIGSAHGSAWKYSTGRVNAGMIEQHMPPPGPDSVVAFCGPPKMNAFLSELLGELNYEEKHFFQY